MIACVWNCYRYVTGRGSSEILLYVTTNDTTVSRRGLPIFYHETNNTMGVKIILSQKDKDQLVVQVGLSPNTLLDNEALHDSRHTGSEDSTGTPKTFTHETQQ